MGVVVDVRHGMSHVLEMDRMGALVSRRLGRHGRASGRDSFN